MTTIVKFAEEQASLRWLFELCDEIRKQKGWLKIPLNQPCNLRTPLIDYEIIAYKCQAYKDFVHSLNIRNWEIGTHIVKTEVIKIK